MVVVALAALQAPSPVLSFAQPDQQHCRHRGCTSQGSGSLTSRRHQVEIKQPSRHGPGSKATATAPGATSAPADPTTAAAPGGAHAHRTVTVRFRVFQTGQSGFTAFLTLHSRWKIGRWSLRFRLPGAHIDRVIGASWQRSASSGGVAVGRPWPWPDADDTMVRITVLGTGRPGIPAGCVFDRAACTFTG
jgi:hypothetical protein